MSKVSVRWVVLAAVITGVALSAMGASKKAVKPTPPNPTTAVQSGSVPGSDKPVAPTSAPATGPANVMAYVNGQPIMMDELNDILLYSYGLPVAQQLIANELVRQEAAKYNLTVTDADIKAEHDSTLVLMFPELKDQGQREKTFTEFLVRKSVTRHQWDMTMRRSALLAKLAKVTLKITDQDLEQAYTDQYGRRVIIRHIQLPSLGDAQAALRELQQGADFGELARKKSTNPTRATGGLLPPISEATVGMPTAIKDAALAFKKPGALSDVIKTGTAFHILKAEQILEAQNVRFDSVKDKIRADLAADRIRQGQTQILEGLVRQANLDGKIQMVNPVLQQTEAEAKAAAAEAGNQGAVEPAQ